MTASESMFARETTGMSAQRIREVLAAARAHQDGGYVNAAFAMAQAEKSELRAAHTCPHGKVSLEWREADGLTRQWRQPCVQCQRAAAFVQPGRARQ